jgi:hypothetical protein
MFSISVLHYTAMLYLQLVIASGLLAIFNLLTSTYAQNSTLNRSNYENCDRDPESFAPNAIVNSTGKVGFRFGEANDRISQNEWYLSVTYNDTSRQESIPGYLTAPHRLQGWLSGPSDASGLACIYKFSSVNASASGLGMNGCNGILSAACISALGNITMFHTGEDDECPDFEATDEMKKQCGNGTIGTVFYSGPLSTSKLQKYTQPVGHPGTVLMLKFIARPLILSNTTCTIPSPQQVSIPNGYLTYPAVDDAPLLQEDDSKYSSPEWYDIYVQQQIPWVIASYLYPWRDSVEIQFSTQVVCVAPNTVMEGGRKPELHFSPREEGPQKEGPPKGGSQDDKQSAGEVADLQSIGQLVIAITGLASLMLIV